MKAKVFYSMVNNTRTEIKAYKKENAVKRFQMLDSSITAKDVKVCNKINSQQTPVEELYNL